MMVEPRPDSTLYHAIARQAQKAIRDSCAGWSDRQIATALIEAGAWPDYQNFQTALDRVRACRSGSKNQVFSNGDLLIIQQATGVHAWHEFEARILGRRSTRLTDAESLGELEDHIRNLGSRGQALLDEMALALHDLSVANERQPKTVMTPVVGIDEEAPVIRFAKPESPGYRVGDTHPTFEQAE